MKWLKICALLFLTLAALRAASWALALLLERFTGLRRRPIVLLSNVIAFGLFLLLLLWSLMPGEPLDPAAVLFGLVVFAVFAWMDRYWTPWQRGKLHEDDNQSSGAV